MEILEKMRFLAEEVIVTRLKPTQEETAFNSSRVTKDNDTLIYCEVIKVGEEQNKIKLGDKILIREDFLSKIKIDGTGTLENTYSLVNQKPIFSVCSN